MEPRSTDTFTTTYCSIDKTGAKPTQSGYFLPMIDGPTRTLPRLESHVTRLHAKCASHEPHRHPEEEIIIGRIGLVDVEVEGHVHTLAAGDMLVIASGDLHGVRNSSNAVAEYYVIRMFTVLEPAQSK